MLRLNCFTSTLALAVLGCVCGSVQADDWPRFRGPAGSGVAAETESIPLTWSPQANLAWKTELPGPGASSPIVSGGRVFVTCYSGYGLSQEAPGEISNLMRHLVCVDLKSGQKLWQRDVPAAQPEDPFTGVGVTAHGYASHTPVADQDGVYAFFGKSGVHAFDLEGNPLWQVEVGMESDPAKWGSSSSPILFEDLLIVTASCESQSIIGLDKRTGQEVWRQEAKGLDNMWGTPTLVAVDDQRTDLVMCVSKEMWGLDPNTGELRWYADATGADHAYSSVVFDQNRVFAFTSRGGGSIAIDVGGSGDISQSRTVWIGRDNASFASPVRYQSRLYLVASGIVAAVDATNGKRIQQLRLKGAEQTGGRFGSLDYPSPILVGKHLMYLNGSGQMFVFDVSGEKMEQVALNKVTTDREVFWGTPAVADDHLVIRSSRHLYAVTDKGETVPQNSDLLASSEDPAKGERAEQGRGGAGVGRQQFNPESMFGSMDTNQDGQLTSDELEGNRMAERLLTLDRDGDGAISKEEFLAGISQLIAQGQRGGGRAGGAGGQGNYPEPQAKPDRPQRPKMTDQPD